MNVQQVLAMKNKKKVSARWSAIIAGGLRVWHLILT